MKTEFVDVSETRKNLVVEIESSTVDAEIDRVARDYTKAARIPGFRPGKVPARVVKQRFRSQILHDVVHERYPRHGPAYYRERERLARERLAVVHPDSETAYGLTELERNAVAQARFQRFNIST